MYNVHGIIGANNIHFWLRFLGSSILLHVLGHLAHFPRWGYTALLCAVKKSQTGTVAALLKIGANIEHEDRCLFKVTQAVIWMETQSTHDLVVQWIRQIRNIFLKSSNLMQTLCRWCEMATLEVK